MPKGGKGRPPAPTGDAAGMAAAIAQARKAGEEVPVGAVVALADGRVVGEAHNETVKRGDPTAHAELLAVQRALKALAADRLDGCTLYVTLEPCAQCAGAIVLAKVGRLVFGAYDDKAGMCGSLGDIVRHPRLNHQVEVVGGVQAEESGALLKAFFAARRARPSLP